MKIRISRVKGYRDITPRFSVEVQEMRQPVIQEVVLINGIQFTSGQPERLEWVPCQDRTILEQVYNGGIVDWFKKQIQEPDFMHIETDELHRVTKVWHENNGKLAVDICDTDNPRFSIGQFISSLIETSK